jgi:DNA-directed RNA polymerase specialized sigma24 family protein
MNYPPQSNISELLIAWNQGDQQALAELTPLVHRELHRLAHGYLEGEKRGHVLQTTALVNEAFLRLIDWQEVEWQSRAHFVGVSATLMRHILVQFAREQQEAKRGGRLDERQARTVELRFFGGLNLEEVAEVLQVSVSSVRRDWRMGQAWLHQQLRAAI